MSSLLEFLTERDLSELTAEVSVSSEIPYKFKIKALTREKRAEFQGRCKLPDKKRGTNTGIDNAKFQTLVCLECCIEPNFRSEDVLRALGANSPAEAYSKALLPGEDDELYIQICKLSGFDTDINEDIEDAKNS